MLAKWIDARRNRSVTYWQAQSVRTRLITGRREPDLIERTIRAVDQIRHPYDEAHRATCDWNLYSEYRGKDPDLCNLGCVDGS